jgi:hypothetical protein
VNAEKIYGNIAPINKPANISGSTNEIKDFTSRPALWRKPP